MRLRDAMTGDVRKPWLRHWHSVIDDAVGQDPSFDFDAACRDPYSDFRMHFVTWDLSDEDLRRCFGVLPRGTQMCDRAIEMRRSYRGGQPSMPEQEAIELFHRGLNRFAQFSDSEDLRKPVRVTHLTRAEIKIPRADRVAVVFEGIDWNGRVPVENLEASSFLTETLYRLTHSYDVVDYIEWPLYPDPQSIDPFRGYALLALSNRYYPMLDATGPVLFVVDD
jgi:hypothetical protein